jgi:basic membrane protein A
MRKLVTLCLVCTIWLLALAGTTAEPGDRRPPQSYAGKICVVNTPGGGADVLNRSTAEGVRRASQRLRVSTVTLDAADESEIDGNIASFVDAGDCDLIIGVGFLVGMQMEPHIDPNPTQRFAVLDFGYGGIYPNAAEVLFTSDQAAFLAGYVAAGTSDTGTVAVYGGMPYPAVTSFMDGYALGVEYYNDQHGASVQVLGWDPWTQTGRFSGTFDDTSVGRTIGNEMMDQGADVVFPVAGACGLGTMYAAEERRALGDPYALVIGVDYDWYTEYPGYEQVLLSSVLKDFGEAAFDQIYALVRGQWVSGPVEANLGTDALDIAPFYDLADRVPAVVRGDLHAVRVGIIRGTIPTTP